MICKDCIHREVCKDHCDRQYIEGCNTCVIDCCLGMADDCLGFADKSQYIKLPCKARDKVYGIFCGEVYEKTVIAFIINSYTNPPLWIETKFDFATSSRERYDIAIGKTIFTSREEAEKALKERVGDKE